jgi:hypothetical protein
MSAHRPISQNFLYAACWLLALSALSAQDSDLGPDSPPTEAPPAATEAAEAVSDVPLAESATTQTEEESDAVPLAYPEDRYLTMWDKNPFLLKTVVVDQKTESFAKDWALRGIMASDGLYHVSILNKVTGKSERLKEGESGKEFRLVSVNYDKNRRKSSVKVSRGTETAELTYDEGMLSQPVTIQNTQSITAGQNAMPGGNPAVQGNPNSPQGMPGAMQRGPNGQLMPTKAGAGSLRPGMPGYVPGRSGPAPGTQGVPAAPGQPMQPAMAPNGRPVMPGALGASPNPNIQNFNGNPNVQPPAPPPVSRRRQLIPAPVQPSDTDPSSNAPLQ